jgi:hypothetical protein
MGAVYILTVVTYLNGSAWGSTVAFHDYKTMAACEKHKERVLKMIDEAGEANTVGRPRTLRVIARCDKSD